MRATCEIIADIKDGKDVPYEELKMVCLVLSSAAFFFQRDIKALLNGGIIADLKKQMEYSDPETSSQEMGIPSWYWKAVKSDPVKWLGLNRIPGTPEWERTHKTHTTIQEIQKLGVDVIDSQTGNFRGVSDILKDLIKKVDIRPDIEAMQINMDILAGSFLLEPIRRSETDLAKICQVYAEAVSGRNHDLQELNPQYQHIQRLANWY